MDIIFNDTTQLVAWWGAIVATFVLLWDFFKWKASGPKIKTRLVLNMHYDDGKVISTETTENGTIREYEEYCHIELINTGDMPTTVMGISATHKPTKKSAIIHGAFFKAFTAHESKKIPHVLPPGEVWSCRMGMGHYESIFEQNTPEIHVVLSHLDKPLIITASKAANKAFKRDSRKDAASPLT